MLAGNGATGGDADLHHLRRGPLHPVALIGMSEGMEEAVRQVLVGKKALFTGE